MYDEDNKEMNKAMPVLILLALGLGIAILSAIGMVCYYSFIFLWEWGYIILGWVMKIMG